MEDAYELIVFKPSNAVGALPVELLRAVFAQASDVEAKEMDGAKVRFILSGPANALQTLRASLNVTGWKTDTHQFEARCNI